MTNVLEDITRTQNVICSCLFAMEPEESVTSAFLVCEYLKGKKNIKWCVHPINAVRQCDGKFYTLYRALWDDPVKFLITLEWKHVWRTSLAFKTIWRSDINMRAAVKPEIMLETPEQKTTQRWSTKPENVIIQARESQIPQMTDVNCAPVWLAPFKDTKLWCQSARLDVRSSITVSIKKTTFVVTWVNKCARTSYVGVHWLLYISITDVATYVAMDAFCVLV
jgi:hypothetical protein